MGKRAADEGRESAYPDIDFCKDPGIICNSEKVSQISSCLDGYHKESNI